MKKSTAPDIPSGSDRVLLHTCCAPCSGAIVEYLVNNGIRPVIYYCNPNIYPVEEYIIRRDECARYAASLGLEMVEDEYCHDEWKQYIRGHEDQPERGTRCTECFKFRLNRAAQYAQSHGLRDITSTLDSSRWKNHSQIMEAGVWATSRTPDVEFWQRNWRQGGLQERRSAIIKEQGFYNQLYCGCEYSMENMPEGNKADVRRRIRKMVAVMPPESRRAESAAAWERLEKSEIFTKSRCILAYWPMADEIDTRPLIRRWSGSKEFYLPCIEGENLTVKRFCKESDLREGESYNIPEPVGEPVMNLGSIDLVIVPGRAFSRDGYRLGRGKGYYDRLLPQLTGAVKAGVCFECQKLPRIPVDPHDIPMDFII